MINKPSTARSRRHQKQQQAPAERSKTTPDALAAKRRPKGGSSGAGCPGQGQPPTVRCVRHSWSGVCRPAVSYLCPPSPTNNNGIHNAAMAMGLTATAKPSAATAALATLATRHGSASSKGLVDRKLRTSTNSNAPDRHSIQHTPSRAQSSSTA